uniref:CBF domain-containing protein n=1 Tax=Parastrongyloides trichosuri TaxID=131310 RepID=A0A0N4ZTG3_PARTI
MVKIKKKSLTLKKNKTEINIEISNNLVIKHKVDTKWYENEFDDRATDENDLLKGEELKKITDEANKLWKNDCDIYNKKKNNATTSVAWMETVLSKGTFTDKVSAMQLNIRKSPVHSINHLNGLVQICEKKKLRNLFISVKLLKDIFLVDLLPSDRKLIPFSKRPLANLRKLSDNNENLMSKRLILWKFESDLKDIYYRFLKVLDSCSSVTVDNIANQSSALLMDLLMERPERESEILAFIVNQLGNPHKKSAAYIIKLLKKLIEKHPTMKEVVIREVELLLFRKNIPLRTQQYAVGFLTQIYLNVVEKNVAKQLLSIYFALIKMLLGKKNTECKLMDLIIVGVYRMIPFAKDRINELANEIESLYKLIAVAKYSISLRILRIVFKSSLITGVISEQFYSSLYRFMLRDHSAKYQKDLFALIFGAVKNDSVFERQRAFIKRLYQIALVGLPELAAESLYTVGRLVESNKKLVILSKEINSGALKVEDVKTDIEEMDEEETYYDYDIDASGNIVKLEAQVDQSVIISSKVINTKLIEDESLKVTKYFNPLNNTPHYSKADQACDVELFYLRKHYHPVVADFASKLINGKKIFYDSDFKEDLCIIRFLDRFAFQKGKKNSSRNSIKCLAVDSEEYINTKPSKIPLDEKYLHRYACQKLVKEKKDDDNYSINSEEFEEVMKNFTGKCNVEEDDEEMYSSEEEIDDFDIFEKELEQKEKAGKKRKRTTDAEKDLHRVLKNIDVNSDEESEEEIGFDSEHEEAIGSGSDDEFNNVSDNELDNEGAFENSDSDTDGDNPFIDEPQEDEKDYFKDAQENADMLDDFIDTMEQEKKKNKRPIKKRKLRK